MLFCLIDQAQLIEDQALEAGLDAAGARQLCEDFQHELASFNTQTAALGYPVPAPCLDAGGLMQPILAGLRLGLAPGQNTTIFARHQQHSGLQAEVLW